MVQSYEFTCSSFINIFIISFTVLLARHKWLDLIYTLLSNLHVTLIVIKNVLCFEICYNAYICFSVSPWGVFALQLFAAERSQTPPVWCCLLIGLRLMTRGRTASGVSMWKRTRGSCLTSKCKRLHSGVRLEITQGEELRLTPRC